MTHQIGGSEAIAELGQISRLEPPAPIDLPERLQRLDKARRLLAETGADALFVGAGASLRYFAGISWSASERLVGLLLPRNGEPTMLCPRFELGTLTAELAIAVDIDLWEEDESPFEILARRAKALGLRCLALDPGLSFVSAERIRQAAPSLRLVDGSAVVSGCRMIKSHAELALMRAAKAITLDVHRRAARILKTGILASEVKRFIDDAHRASGTSGSSFCAVQFGRSTAFPHGLPGDACLAEGDVVLIDTGCTLEGYHSDITRTYVFGEPTSEVASMWALERDAQQAAFDAVAPGVACEAIDQAARDVLERAGLGPGYRLPGLPHRTGHGIGLEIHEPPYLVRGDTTVLEPGMCFSNEPMIVVPDRFGIRLEDHFHVTDNGAAWFTQPSSAIDRPFD